MAERRQFRRPDLRRRLAAALFAAALAAGGGGPAAAAEPIILEVAAAEICRRLEGLAPVEAGRRFPAEAGRLYCVSRIGGIARPTRVQHTWYRGGEVRFRAAFPVRPPSWRVFSMIRIRPADAGPWRVEISDRDGNVLQTLFFEITS